MAICLELVEQNSASCKIGTTATATSATPIPFWLALLALMGLGATIGVGGSYIAGDTREVYDGS